MITVADKKHCAGCTACAEICPKNCIQMMPDEEGFLYPSVDKNQCIKCNACDVVCPIQNPVAEKETAQKAYLVQHRDESVRLDSAAGGAFTAIATVILQEGGVVFGAAYWGILSFWRKIFSKMEDGSALAERRVRLKGYPSFCENHMKIWSWSMWCAMVFRRLWCGTSIWNTRRSPSPNRTTFAFGINFMAINTQP